MGSRVWILATMAAMALTAATAVAFQNATFRSTVESTIFGKTFTTEIPSLLDSPAWEPEQEHPPLSPREALRLADAMRAKVASDDDEFVKWELSSLSLHPEGKDRWYYRVTYKRHATAEGRPAISGGLSYLSLVVLMDGTALEPKVEAIRTAKPAKQ